MNICPDSDVKPGVNHGLCVLLLTLYVLYFHNLLRRNKPGVEINHGQVPRAKLSSGVNFKENEKIFHVTGRKNFGPNQAQYVKRS